MISGAGSKPAFASYPVHPRGFSFHDVNLPDVPEWTGLFAHWNRGANLAVDFDRWLSVALATIKRDSFPNQTENALQTLYSALLALLLPRRRRFAQGPRLSS